MCTYCGQRNHTAAYCPRRVLFCAILPICVALAACGKTPPAEPIKLTRPSVDVMRDCPELPDIPKDEHKPKVRAAYYAQTRAMYGQCRGAKTALKRWIELITS